MPAPQQLPIYIKLYQFIKFFYERQRNFPKQYKYTLGEDIVSLAWECLDLFLEANSLPNAEKNSKIVQLSNVFDKLKTRLNMSYELKLITEKQYAHMQTYFMREIGTMIGGWLNWSNANCVKNNQLNQ